MNRRTKTTHRIRRTMYRPTTPPFARGFLLWFYGLHDGRSFDLHQDVRVDEPGHAHGGVGGTDLCEDLAVGPSGLLPRGDVAEEDPGPDDVVERRAGSRQCLTDGGQRGAGLGGHA